MADETQVLETVEPKKKIRPIEQKKAEPVALTVESAKALLELQSKMRADDCAKELDALLKKYNCQIIGQYIFDHNGARINFSIAALKEE